MEAKDSICQNNSWDDLGADLSEKILSNLPIKYIVRAACVCKSWSSIISSSSFRARFEASSKPLLFLYFQDNLYSRTNQAFAYDPQSVEWIKIPTKPNSFPGELPIGSKGFLIDISSNRFSFRTILKGPRHQTSPLQISRHQPLVDVYSDGSEIPRFIVVGGLSCDAALYMQDRMAMEIYNPDFDIWEICTPLPSEFRLGHSSGPMLCSAMSKGKFYIYGIHSFFVSYFELDMNSWTQVRTLRPPGVIYSFLISCQDRLILAGLCNPPDGVAFNVWRIDNEETMEFSEFTRMPQELLLYMFDDVGHDKIVFLKCVGLGNLIYVINEENCLDYKVCVCEIISSQSRKCRWSKVPNLPVSVNKLSKMSFCSQVSLDYIHSCR